jgi:hypothetical protein
MILDINFILYQCIGDHVPFHFWILLMCSNLGFPLLFAIFLVHQFEYSYWQHKTTGAD